MYGQPYIVRLQLEMPESAVNQRLGNVVVVMWFSRQIIANLNVAKRVSCLTVLEALAMMRYVNLCFTFRYIITLRYTDGNMLFLSWLLSAYNRNSIVLNCG